MLLSKEPQDLDFELAVGFLRSAGLDVDAVRVDASAPSMLAGVQTKRPARLVYLHLSSRSYLGTLLQVVPVLAATSWRPLLVAGGPFASGHALPLLKQLEDLDAVILGETEATLSAVARTLAEGQAWWQEPGLWRRHDGGVERTLPRSPLEDLDSLPMAATDLVRPEDRTRDRRILVGRGCNSDCSYCDLHISNREAFPLRQRFWRARSPRAVVDEMEHLRRHRGIDRFRLNSFVFFGYDEEGSRMVEEIAREILARGLAVRFSFVTHPGHLRRNHALLPILVQAGLEYLVLGIDSVIQRARLLYRLPFGDEDIIASLTTLNRQAIPFHTGYIFYDPYTSLDEIRETISFWRAARHLYGHLGVPYGFLLHRQILNTVLKLNTTTPVVQQLRGDGLLVREGTLEHAPLARFREPAVGRFLQLHRRFNREILRSVAPLIFRPEIEERFPDVAFFLLDVLETMRLWLEADPHLESDEALFALRAQTCTALAPAYKASLEAGFPRLQRRELVDDFFVAS